MLEAGVVVAIQASQATVKMERHSACAECGLCHKLAHSPREMVLIARNSAGAQIGDFVRISVPDVGVVRASFWAYGVPTIGMIAGGILGWHAFAALGLSAEVGAAGLGIAAMVAAFWVVSRYDRRLRGSWRGPEIVDVISAAGAQAAAERERGSES